MFKIMSMGTAKLNTERIENVFGATKGSTYDSNSIVATTELNKNMILLIKPNFFIIMTYLSLIFSNFE